MDDQDNGGSQPCAMCRHRRKRCDGDCEFAPLFPGNRYEEFQNALRLYSIRRLKTLIRSVEPEEQKTCAESILAESNAWRNYHNPGCLAISRNLKTQIDSALWELQIVRQQQAFFRGMQMKKMDNSVAGSLLACNIPSQSGQLQDLDCQRPWLDEMILSRQPSEYQGRESQMRECVQILNNQGESSSVSKIDDKGKKIPDK